MFQGNSHFSNVVRHNKNLSLEGSRREQQGNNNVVTELVDEQHSDHAESYSLFQPSKKSKHMQVKQIKNLIFYNLCFCILNNFAHTNLVVKEEFRYKYNNE
jgi:hypothetical protein